ncbi:MAG: ribonuclease Z, partial [Deltaproteobacteria bacterium]|nr:ribonuclease Z [Deltaproteobacteria bacterium]
SLQRSSCSVLVETNDSKLVLDCGVGTMHRLLQAKITIDEVTHMFFSHFHPDHTAEFVPFLFASKYPKSARRTTPLHVVAGKGVKRFYENLKHVFGEWIDLGVGLLDLIELDITSGDIRCFSDITVQSMPVRHRKESLAFRITGPEGTSVVYSGDTDVCQGLVRIAKDADLFICESAMPDGKKVDGHLTPSLAGEIATRANVKKLVLTHLYPACDKVDIEKQCRKTYRGPLVVARDLLVFVLNRP